MNQIRTLTPREIDCRISQIKTTGLQLLLYKDARVDMDILDETVGAMNWKREHSRDNANCTVSIWDDEKKQWVSKEDTGTESNTEAEKGLASDSFKRACVNWGIGRELYTAPFIWITPQLCDIKTDGGKPRCFDRFEVTEIGYNEHREITKLVIANVTKKQIVFAMGKDEKKEETEKLPITPTKVKLLKQKCEGWKVTEEALCSLYRVAKMEDITEKMFRHILEHEKEIIERLAHE